MSLADLISFFGYLTAAWVSGFCGGLLLTYVKRAFEQAV